MVYLYNGIFIPYSNENAQTRATHQIVAPQNCNVSKLSKK